MTNQNIKINRYVKEFLIALDDEIEAAREAGGQKILLTNGKLIGINFGKYIYSFTADYEIDFPDETKIEIQITPRRTSPGKIIATDGFKIFLELESSFGRKIEKAWMITEPWFLLEELQARLRKHGNSKEGITTSIELFLSQKTPQLFEPERAEKVVELIQKIEDELTEKLLFNESQVKAVENAFSRSTTFVWGPPGTGKTKTLGLLAACFVKYGMRVLIVSHANAAVNEAIKSTGNLVKLSKEYEEGKIIRYGATKKGDLGELKLLDIMEVIKQHHPELVNSIREHKRQIESLTKLADEKIDNFAESYDIGERIKVTRQELNKARKELKLKQPDYIKRSKLVATTLSKVVISPEIYEGDFDIVIIDEASMVFIPQCFLMGCIAKHRLVIFGDFRQLGPISRASTERAENWLKRDIFHACGITESVDRGDDDPRITLLDTQYRMNSLVSKIPNQIFYRGKLKNGEDVDKKTEYIITSDPFGGVSLAYCSTASLSAVCHIEQEATHYFRMPSKSRFNFLSALLSVELACRAIEDASGNVGIITPYNAQSRLIHRILSDLKISQDKIKVATVHKFQGSERDVIIFDSVEGNPRRDFGKPLVGTISSSAARLCNVAITRARGKFLLIGDFRYLIDKMNAGTIFRRIVDEIKRNGEYQMLAWDHVAQNGSSQMQGFAFSISKISFYPSIENAYDKIVESLKDSQQLVFHCSSKRVDTLLFLPIIAESTAKDSKIHLTGGLADDIKKKIFKHAKCFCKSLDLGISILGVDKKEIWIQLNPNTKSSCVIHLAMEQTVNLLYTFWNFIPEFS